MKAPEVVSALESGITEIWSRPPADLDGLAQEYRPPSGDMAKRLYANFDLYSIAGFFYFAWKQMRANTQPPAGLAALLSDYAETSARRLATWGMKDASGLVAQAGQALAGAEANEELDTLLRPLIVYLNRLQAWVDTTIPWAKMGDLSPIPLTPED